MSGEERRFGGGRYLPIMARLWDGEVNPAFPWPRAKDENAASSVYQLTSAKMDLTVTRHLSNGCVVVTRGATVLAVYGLPSCLSPGSVVTMDWSAPQC